MTRLRLEMTAEINKVANFTHHGDANREPIVYPEVTPVVGTTSR